MCYLLRWLPFCYICISDLGCNTLPSQALLHALHEQNVVSRLNLHQPTSLAILMAQHPRSWRVQGFITKGQQGPNSQDIVITYPDDLVLIMLAGFCKLVFSCQDLIETCTFPNAQKTVCLICGHLRCCMSRDTSVKAKGKGDPNACEEEKRCEAHRLLAGLLTLLLGTL